MHTFSQTEPGLGLTGPEAMTERYRTLLIFGAPGSGKGTQGKAIGSVPRFFPLRLRRRVPLAGHAHEDRAGVPVLFQPRRTRPGGDHHRTLAGADSVGNVEAHRFKPDLDYLVLDGIPRNVEQARADEGATSR